MSASAERKRAAGAVFLSCLCFYLLTAGGHLYTADDWAKYKVTEALIERGSVEVPREPHVYGVPGRDGMWVSIFPVGTSLAAIPFYLIGRLIPVSGGHARDIILRGSVSLLNQFVLASACAVLFLVVHAMCGEVRRAFLATAAFAIGTMAWPYAKHFWSEPSAALCVLGATLALWRCREPRPRTVFVAGVLCGTACLFKYEAVLLLAGMPYWILRHARACSRLGLLGVWLLGGLLLAVPALWYNWLRFGSPWQLAYGGDVGAEAGGAMVGGVPLLVGLKSLLLSLLGPGRGLLWYNLPLAAAAVGWRRLARHRPAHSWFLALTVVPLPVFLAVTGRTATWAWGPRLLFPLTAFLVLPAAFATRWLKPALACAVVINVGAVGVNFHDAIEAIRRDGGFGGWEWTEAVENQPRYTPILWHLRLLGPYTCRTVQNIAGRPQPGLEQGSLDAYRVGMRKDSLDVIWLVLASAGAPRWLVVAAVVILGVSSLGSSRLALRFSQ